MKKKISIFTITFVVLSALIAILGLFVFFEFEGASVYLLLTCLTFSVAGLLTLNSYNMLEKKNKLALASLSLIIISSTFVIITLWTNIPMSNLFTKITLTTCILSICFNIITSYILKLQNKYLALQLPSYICFAVIAFFLTCLVWGSDIIENNTKIFILFIILSLLESAILAVFSKRQTNETPLNQSYIKIPKTEYEDLLSIKEKYLKLKENSKWLITQIKKGLLQ